MKYNNLFYLDLKDDYYKTLWCSVLCFGDVATYEYPKISYSVENSKAHPNCTEYQF